MCISGIRHFQLPNLITELSLILQLTGKLVTPNEETTARQDDTFKFVDFMRLY